MNELTKAEEQIMQILWKLQRGFVKDILEEIPEPKPAYNTISTIVRTLEKKGFVKFKSYGGSHQYFPCIEKEDYKKYFMKRVINNYFDNSIHQLVSFFSKEGNISVNDVDEAIQLMQELKTKIKTE